MEIDILSLVKKLRSETQAPLGDCQKALKHTSGNYDEAKLYLRKLGLANADKKSLRTTENGFVAAFSKGGFGVMIELNSETDFVSRSSIFQSLITTILLTAFHNKVDNIDDLMKFKIDTRVINSYVPLVTEMSDSNFSINNDEIAQINGESIDHAIKIIISIVGENISLSRLKMLSVKEGIVISYLHSRQSPIIGTAGVLIALETDVKSDEIKDLAKNLAIHFVACRPDVIHQEQLSSDLIEKEKEVYRHQVEKEGKTGEIAEKIIMGKLARYYEKAILMKQPYFFDSNLKISELLENKRAEIGAKKLDVVEFQMFFVGNSES